MDTRYVSVLFAYPAGENVAESESEQERVWKENRHNAQ